MTPHTILTFNALVFGLFGLIFIVAPLEAALFVTGGAPEIPSAIIDMRATYGGTFLGIGVLFFIMNRQSGTQKPGLIALILILAGMAFGRITGFILDGNPNWVMYLFLVYEFVFIAITVHALNSHFSDVKRAE